MCAARLGHTITKLNSSLAGDVELEALVAAANADGNDGDKKMMKP